MGKIIAVANQKGGTGKSNTVVTLGAGLAAAGYRVLLVDLDTQGHIAVCLGLEKSPDLSSWLGAGLPLARVVTPARERLDIVRGDIATADLKTTLAGRRFSEYVLTKALTNNPYDVVLLDCAPSTDILHTAALMAADWLLIPARMEHLSMDGIGEIFSTLGSLREFNSQCRLGAILPTFYNRSIKDHSKQLANLARNFGANVWPPIPTDSRVPAANEAGVTLWELGGRAPRALEGYREVLVRLRGLL